MNIQFTKETEMTKNYDNIVSQLTLPFQNQIGKYLNNYNTQYS